VKKVSINGVEYDLSKLSDNGKAQVASLQFLEIHMSILRSEIAVYETARNTYVTALKAAIDGEDT
tara:strand:+ start:108 stop:302 length:195 start_codon:yes stop_codon:yes gene_type:complete